MQVLPAKTFSVIPGSVLLGFDARGAEYIQPAASYGDLAQVSDGYQGGAQKAFHLERQQQGTCQ